MEKPHLAKRQQKYFELKEKIESDIDIRAKSQAETLTILLKKAAKLLEGLKLRAESKQPGPIEEQELYQVMQM